MKNNFSLGDLAEMCNIEPNPIRVTILGKSTHPFLKFLHSYTVLGVNGVKYSVSESFLRALP
jgi:hypothetical protein